MKENNIAKILSIIGKVVICCGVVLSFISLAVFAGASDGAIAFISFILILLSSVISGALFLGFAEVINLLQLNVFKTEKLIKLAENKEK